MIDWKAALPCLVKILDSLKADVVAPTFSADAKSRILSVTGALRSVVTKLNAADAAAGNTDGLDDFIRRFRLSDNRDVISVLSYGARSEIYDIRLISILLLGNIIDNTFVCVSLAHLNDPTLLSSSNGFNGRANLLGIVSVMAPWAYKENYDSIDKKRVFILGQIQGDDPKLKNTLVILENIRARLNSQNSDSNKNVKMPKAWSDGCRAYIDKFQPKLPSLDNVRY